MCIVCIHYNKGLITKDEIPNALFETVVTDPDNADVEHINEVIDMVLGEENQ